MARRSPSPVHIAVDHPREGLVTLFWDDGRDTTLSLTELRKACPCASCMELRQQMSQSDGLTLMTSDAINPSVEVVDLQMVGRYAVQFTWKDGHNTGLYTYEFLRDFEPAS